MMTFPSWRPNRRLDHILVSPSLRLAKAEVLNYAHSDHLPISVELVLPDELILATAA
jgi:endonuclease/exonuclease/phosphatase family metal-dependent hydrolase